MDWLVEANALLVGSNLNSGLKVCSGEGGGGRLD